MHHDRLITGVAAALGGSAVLLAVVAILYNPAVIVLALALGAAAYFMWYQASGRLAARVYRSVEQQAARNNGRRRQPTGPESSGLGAGPRENWTPPGGQQRRQFRGRGRGGRKQRQQRQNGRSRSDHLTREEAFRTLGLDPGADEAAVKQAYRDRVKEVHPDNGGSEAAFKRVKRAYERLT